MDLTPLIKLARQFSNGVSANSPSILTGLGIAGFVTTVILAVKATPKAQDALYQEDNYRIREWHDKFGPSEPCPDMTTFEKVDVAWRYYVPTTLMGATSIACVLYATSIQHRRNVALTGLYAIAESSLKDYQRKVVEVVGQRKEEAIRSDIAKDQLSKNKLDPQAIIVSGLGDTLCFDQYTGRYFKGDVEDIRKKINNFNRQLLSDMRIPLNDLYSDLGLEPVDSGQYVGWDIEKGLLDIDFSAKLASGNVPCIVLTFVNKPTKLW